MGNDPPDDSDKRELGGLRQSGSSPEKQPDMIGSRSDEEGSEVPAPSSEPPETATTDWEIETLKQFFEKKGAVEILVLLADGPKQFKEINSTLIVSRATVSNRLTQGVRLDLWGEYISYPEDGRKIKLYHLNPNAEQFATLANEADIGDSAKELRKAKQKHEESLEIFQNQLGATE